MLSVHFERYQVGLAPLCLRLLAQDTRRREMEDTVSSSGPTNVWNLLWKVDVPPKVRGFFLVEVIDGYITPSSY